MKDNGWDKRSLIHPLSFIFHPSEERLTAKAINRRGKAEVTSLTPKIVTFFKAPAKPVTYPCSLSSSIRRHCSSLTGITDSRGKRTKSQPASSGSSLIRASGTG
jgi:hypothetical protein